MAMQIDTPISRAKQMRFDLLTKAGASTFISLTPGFSPVLMTGAIMYAGSFGSLMTWNRDFSQLEKKTRFLQKVRLSGDEAAGFKSKK